MPILPKLTLFVFASLTALCLHANDQIYQSTNADGTVTFSDTPSEGSREVHVGTPNVADSVDVPPPSADPAPAAPAPAAKKQAQPPVQERYDDDDDSGCYGCRAKARARAKRHGVHRSHRGGR